MLEDTSPDPSAAARALGRRGGNARAKIGKAKLSAIGKAGAAARWRGHKKKQAPPGE